MELDINPNWVSGAYFHDRVGAPPSGFRLFPGEKVAAEHYMVASSRDWFSWSLRSPGPQLDMARSHDRNSRAGNGSLGPVGHPLSQHGRRSRSQH